MQEAIALIKQKLEEEVQFWRDDIEYLSDPGTSDSSRRGFRKGSMKMLSDAKFMNHELEILLENFTGDNAIVLLDNVERYINGGETLACDRIIDKYNGIVKRLRRLPVFGGTEE